MFVDFISISTFVVAFLQRLDGTLSSASKGRDLHPVIVRHIKARAMSVKDIANIWSYAVVKVVSQSHDAIDVGQTAVTCKSFCALTVHRYHRYTELKDIYTR